MNFNIKYFKSKIVLISTQAELTLVAPCEVMSQGRLDYIEVSSKHERRARITCYIYNDTRLPSSSSTYTPQYVLILRDKVHDRVIATHVLHVPDTS